MWAPKSFLTPLENVEGGGRVCVSGLLLLRKCRLGLMEATVGVEVLSREGVPGKVPPVRCLPS